MSGLAGWISDNLDLTKQEQILSKMSLTLKNRGPDDFGELVMPNAALLHRRLKISQSDTAQPLTIISKGQKYTLVFNGELYNAQEVSAELKSLGFEFESNSD